MSSAPHERWSRFLCDEESFLRECRETLAQVRDLLKTPTQEATDEALKMQERLHRVVALRREERRAWLESQPTDPADTVPPEMQERRRRLRQDARLLTSELKHQAIFLQASLDCYQAFFTDLFGGAVTEGRYGRHGKYNPTANLVFVETRG